MKWIQIIILQSMVAVLPLQAQNNVVITSISQNGLLEWSGPTNGISNYRVEWASSLDGPWSSTWTNLATIAPTNTMLSAKVPMFYRVVAQQPAPRLPGDLCADAPVIMPGTLSGQSLVGYTNDYTPSGCLSTQYGADRVYAITVPASQLLTASVIPPDGNHGDPSIYLTATCGASPLVCLAGDDEGSAASVNTVSYRNAGTSAQVVYIVIDSYTGSLPVTDFSLATSLSL